MTRHFWVLVHRYAGLYMALFLTVAGLTGSILAFLREIGDWVDPPPAIAAPAGAHAALDPMVLRERAVALLPQARFNAIDLHPELDRPVTFYVDPRTDPATGKAYVVPVQSLMLDPYTGAELRRVAAPADPEAYAYWPITRENLMNFIYALHYTFTIPGSLGVWLFGIAALVWTLDCFVGFYLTLPVRARRRAGVTPTARRSWWTRWKPAWLVKWQGSAYRINFDLHRAGGLWTWAMLFVFAWSSVAFNLGEQVYTPVMKALFDMHDPMDDIAKLEQPRETPHTPWPQALATARRLMAAEAAAHGLQVQHEQALYYDTERAAFMYVVKSDRDIAERYGQTTLMFGDDDPRLLSLSLPSGQDAGRTVTGWLVALHMATVWGIPMKIFVCAMGLVIAMLSITGVYLWLKKRQARRARGATQVKEELRSVVLE